MTLLVYGLTHAATKGWTDQVTLTALDVAVVLLVAFVFIEQRSPHALMPLHIFANRNRSGTYTMMLTIGAAIFAMFFFLTQFIRNILGYSPLKAGVAFLPVTVTVTIGALAAISARLVGRVGPKLPMTVGPSLAAVGLFWLSFIQADTDCWKVLLPTLFIAMGRGTSFVPLTLTAVSGVRRDEAGLASALLNTGQQIGGSLGLAILVTVSTSATSTKLAHLLGSGSATAASGTPGAAGGVPRAVLNQAVTAGYGAKRRWRWLGPPPPTGCLPGGCRDRAACGDHFPGGDPGAPPGPARRGRAGPGLRRAPMRPW